MIETSRDKRATFEESHTLTSSATVNAEDAVPLLEAGVFAEGSAAQMADVHGLPAPAPLPEPKAKPKAKGKGKAKAKAKAAAALNGSDGGTLPNEVDSELPTTRLQRANALKKHAPPVSFLQNKRSHQFEALCFFEKKDPLAGIQRRLLRFFLG